MLGALAGTDVPHADLVAVCEDPAVMDGAVFYLMEPINGLNASDELPALHATEPAVRHQMGLEVVDALAALHQVDPGTVGLDGFGKPEGFLERQVSRWLAELASYDDLAAYPGPDIGDVAGVAEWLERTRPDGFTPGILHGDFHASNVMFSRTGPDVVAIVDWEMSTLGDPLLDLGWLLATWELPGAPAEFAGALASAGGLASPGELVDRYARQSERDLSRIDWYVVLACFKLGILLEGSHARALAGLAPPEIGDRLHETTCQLFARATHLMNGNP